MVQVKSELRLEINKEEAINFILSKMFEAEMRPTKEYFSIDPVLRKMKYYIWLKENNLIDDNHLKELIKNLKY